MDPLGLRIQALCVAAMVMLNLSLSIAWARTLGAAGPLLASATSVAICQLIPGILYIRKRE
jgi:hypothetical protein